MIFFIHGNTKPNIEGSGWWIQTKNTYSWHFRHDNYQSIPPYFMALGFSLFLILWPFFFTKVCLPLSQMSVCHKKSQEKQSIYIYFFIFLVVGLPHQKLFWDHLEYMQSTLDTDLVWAFWPNFHPFPLLWASASSMLKIYIFAKTM